MNKLATKNTEIIYGVWAEQLILIPKERALELASIHGALNASKTWGEFKSRVPAHVYKEVLRMIRSELDEDEERVFLIPKPDSPFDPDDIPGYADGDWPGWPAQEMLKWMPKDIQQKYGKVEISVLNGDFLEIGPGREAEVIAALEDCGYKCTKDTNLIERACGG